MPGALAGLRSPRQLHYAGQNGSGVAAPPAVPWRQASQDLSRIGPKQRTRETLLMTSATFDFAPLLPAGLPAPAAKWTGLAKYSFVGGNNDPDQVPVEGLIDAVNAVLKREGKTLATYGLASGPQGYRPLARISHCETQARRRDRLRRRRHPDRLRLAAGARPRQRDAAGARRHRHHRAGYLSGLAEPADAARRQCGRHSARRRRHADGRAGRGARRPQTPRHHAEIHLHHPDRAEPDRHHHAGGAPRRTPEASQAIWRADLRGRLLCRPDLGRQAPARDPCHEQERQRHPYRLVLQVDRAGVAGRLHRRALGAAVADAGAEDRRRLAARWNRWCSRNIARRISPRMCRS